MTKSAKLHAASSALDPDVAGRGSAAQRQPERADAGMAPEMESELVAELETALQAVLKRAPQLQPASPPPPGPAAAALPRDGGPGSAPQPFHRAVTVPGAAAEAARQSYPRLQPAEAPRPPRVLSWELDAPPERPQPPADQPRRRIGMRAALCVTGLLGLAAAGALALTSLAAPGDPAAVTQGAPAAEAAPPAAVDAVSQAAQAPVTGPAATAETAGADAIASVGIAGGETGGGRVTLLRPVGQPKAAAARLPARSGSSVGDGDIVDGESTVAAESKLPDRLVGTSSPGSVPPMEDQAEPNAPPLDGTDQPAQGPVAPTGPAEAPAAAQDAPVPSAPGPNDELVAATGPRPANEAAGVDVSHGAAGETPEPSIVATSPTDVAAATPAGAPEATRTAPVTSAVNMRASPDNDARIVTVIPAGSQVGVIECEYWCEVVFAGERGWVYKSFVAGGT